ncbi:LacI family DNA-binding transcriptional regulator [Paenibacillus senegalensis]|uniref:LacI family DNA-binding transcriptional regulator n=1 Tax=Paenibacillus senegalensis TaxID=1465766 RepID=UPI000288D9E5|nr:LacI family DNA-binding transcriptional regulator [Paenibacillus senegalensis]
MPTLKEIAQHAGVSISTVSRVLNNDLSRHFSEETKVKIRNAAKELGYDPSDSVKSAGRRSTSSPETKQRKIGCIVAVPQNKYNHPYFSPILEGIEQQLDELGHRLTFVSTVKELQGEEEMRRRIRESGLDGFIIVEGIAPEMYQSIKEMVPAVVGIDISDLTVPVVSYDRVQAAKSAVRHLISQGHQRIAFIGGTGLTGDLDREKRYRGYRYALQEAGLEVDARLVVNAGWDVDVSYARMADLLAGQEIELPTAVFAASDMLAISAMRAVTEQGLRIPEDIAFVGLDNIELSQYTSPPLSTIHIPKSEIGRMAAKILIDELEGKHPLPFKAFMPFQLLIRASSEFTRTNGE